MELYEFIENSMQQIRGGIFQFNQSDPQYHARLPEKIEFDLAVFVDGADIKIADAFSTNITRLQLTIYPAHYPWLKKS